MMTAGIPALHPARVSGLRALRALERGFDLAFRAAANPWRHLGALTFFFFWIVTASGIYLFIFFDTSVAGAYRSVDALTHGQWYAGGLMRSLHRYASDAFAVTLVLHVLKELLAGRFRGFRWFSWVSGVPLLWLALASGVVGYWLVWDELAQFVALATAEWFDALPLFSEPLVRNFLYPESVSDRLFTLLIFLHIGVPLALLLGMFVHIQRVNFADVVPARALGWGTLAALIVLSLVKPATSTPPADLASAPQAVPLDWFYLALYPLLYEWSPEWLWALAAAATVVLLVLPWVARGEPVPVARVDPANCNGCGRCFADCPYAAVVMRPRPGDRAARQLAMVLPGLCAGCGICTGACPSSTPFRSGERLATGIDMPQQPIDTVRLALERELLHLVREDGARDLHPRPLPGQSGERKFAAQAGTTPLAQESFRRIVVFGCDQGARVSAIREPGVAAFSLLCIGMLPPAFVEYALRNGADGVLVAACREGECAYRLGERWLRDRLSGAREPHLRPSVPHERIRLIGAGAGEEKILQQELAAMRAALVSLPRNVRRPSSRDRKGIRERSHAA